MGLLEEVLREEEDTLLVEDVCCVDALELLFELITGAGLLEGFTECPVVADRGGCSVGALVMWISFFPSPEILFDCLITAAVFSLLGFVGSTNS
jgi:hypothetical protein